MTRENSAANRVTESEAERTTAGPNETTLLLEIKFKKGWGGNGNVLKVMGLLQEMASTETVELKDVDFEESF